MESPFPVLNEHEMNSDDPKDAYYQGYIQSLHEYYQARLKAKKDKIRQLKEHLNLQKL